MTDSLPANHENKGVIPAQAGIQNNIREMDSCFRKNDKKMALFIFYVIPMFQIQIPKQK